VILLTFPDSVCIELETFFFPSSFCSAFALLCLDVHYQLDWEIALYSYGKSYPWLSCLELLDFLMINHRSSFFFFFEELEF